MDIHPPPLKIRFGHLASMTGKSFSSGELIIRDGRFVFIGERTRSGFDGETIDLSDCLVLPGFVNAHCHLTLSGLKGRLSKNLSFVDWVLSLIEIESDLKEEERVAAFQTGANEMLLSGVTTLGDYLGNFEWLPHYEKIPFRQVVFLEAIGFRKEKSRETARKIKAVLKSGSPAQDRITLGVAPHAPYSVSPELFQLLYKLAKDHSVPISCHVAELEEEKEFLQTGGGALRHLLGKREAWEPKWKPPGKSTLSYLADLEVLDSLIAIHLNHIGTDWKLLRANQMSAVFCPRSSRWFRRRKYMDVKEFLDCGIPVGLGTDSLASNHSLNFLEELRAASEMASEVGPLQILELATCYGARVLGLDCGTIALGKPADLIAFRIAKDVKDDWIKIPFESARTEVDFSMIAGKILIRK